MVCDTLVSHGGRSRGFAYVATSDLRAAPPDSSPRQKFNKPVLNKVVKFWKYIIFAEN